MTSEIVDLHFTYTESEIVSAIRLSYRRTHKMGAHAAIAFVAMAFGLIGINNHPGNLLWYGLFFGGALMLALYSLAYFYVPRKRVKGQTTLSNGCHATFSDEQIIFGTEDFEVHFKWSYYQEVWELTDYYLLIRADKAFTLIPKRSFSGEEQESVFRTMLINHLGRLIRLHRQATKQADVVTEYVPKSLEPPDWR